MRGRPGVKRAAVGAAAVAVVAVVGILVRSDHGLPFIPAKPSTTSSLDPAGLPPDGPTIDSGALFALLYDVEADGLSTPMRFQLSDAGTDLHTGVDRDRPRVPSAPDGSTRSVEGALASVLLALILLKAARDQDRDRRHLRTAAPASAGEPQTPAPVHAGAGR